MQRRMTYIETRDDVTYVAEIHRNWEGLRIMYFVNDKHIGTEIMQKPCSEPECEALCEAWVKGKRKARI